MTNALFWNSAFIWIRVGKTFLVTRYKRDRMESFRIEFAVSIFINSRFPVKQDYSWLIEHSISSWASFSGWWHRTSECSYQLPSTTMDGFHVVVYSTQSMTSLTVANESNIFFLCFEFIQSVWIWLPQTLNFWLLSWFQSMLKKGASHNFSYAKATLDLALIINQL